MKLESIEKENEFITENYLKYPVKRIAVMIGRSGTCVSGRIKKLGLVIPPEIREQRKKANQFSKGFVPKNKGKKIEEFMKPEQIEKIKKTQFKKGNIPHNSNYDGHERITKDGYIEIRVSKGVYRLKHIVEWEKENGALKNGYCLRNKDGNKLNTSADNWELKLRGENMLLNSRYKPHKELIPSMALVSKINKHINTIENGKK